MPTQWADSGGRAETYFSSISNPLQPTNLLLDAMSCHFEDSKVADVSFFSDGSQLARERFCKEYNRVDWWRRKKCPFQWTSEGECILMFRSEQKKEAKKVPTVSGRLPMLAHWPICPVGNAGKPTNSSAADLVHTNMQVSLAKNASEAKDFVSPKNCHPLSMGEHLSSRSTWWNWKWEGTAFLNYYLRVATVIVCPGECLFDFMIILW